MNPSDIFIRARRLLCPLFFESLLSAKIKCFIGRILINFSGLPINAIGVTLRALIAMQILSFGICSVSEKFSSKRTD